MSSETQIKLIFISEVVCLRKLLILKWQLKLLLKNNFSKYFHNYPVFSNLMKLKTWFCFSEDCWDWKLLSWVIHISLSIVISSLFLKACDFFLRVPLERHTRSYTHCLSVSKVHVNSLYIWVILLTYKFWCSRSVTDPLCFVFLTMSPMMLRLFMLSSKIQDAFRKE